ncbi:MAG: hypothetical protein WEG40_05185 [Candidatus Rokuibacteriota bacterium]
MGLVLRSKPDVIAAVILAAMIIALWAPRAVGPLDFRWDGGVYYVLGTAIAEGKGYRLLNEPGDIEANQYPPLLPLIVAFHQWLVGSSDFVVVGRWMRLSYFLIFTTYIFAAYAVLRRYLPLPWAFLAAVVVLLHPQTSFISDLCFAELPFALATTLFVLLAGRQTGPIRSTAAGACAVAAYLLRTMGIALLGAWVLDAILGRRFRTAAIRAVVALVPILGWNAYIAHVERSPDYTQPAYAYQRADYLFYNVSYARNVSLHDPFKPDGGKASVPEVAHRWLVNLAHMPKSLGTAVTARAYSWERIKEIPIIGRVVPWRVVLYLPIVIGLVVLVGVWSLLTREARLIGLYVLLTAAGICLTPWPWRGQWERYWAPVTPFLALALARGAMTLAAWSERLPAPLRRVSHAGRIAVVVAVLAVEALVLTRMYVQYRYPATLRDRGGHVAAQRLFFYDEHHQALESGLDWLGRRAGPGDVVAASMPQWVYLLTGLKAVMPPFETDPARAQALLDSVPVRFVVVDGAWPPITRDYALPLLASSPERWLLVYSNPSGRLEIYERRPEPTRNRP